MTTFKKVKSGTGSKQIVKPTKLQPSNSRNFSKRVKARFAIFSSTNLVVIRRELAEKYSIKSDDIEKLCNQNIQIAAQFGRQNIIKIWELLKFITYSSNQASIERFNPDFGRPWSISVFGRSLVNNLIDNCITSNDIQTAAMIISKLKLNDHNHNLARIAKKSKSSVDMLDINHKNSSLSSSVDASDENTSSIFEDSDISEIEQPDEIAIQCKNFG